MLLKEVVVYLCAALNHLSNVFDGSGHQKLDPASSARPASPLRIAHDPDSMDYDELVKEFYTGLNKLTQKFDPWPLAADGPAINQDQVTSIAHEVQSGYDQQQNPAAITEPVTENPDVLNTKPYKLVGTGIRYTDILDDHEEPPAGSFSSVPPHGLSYNQDVHSMEEHASEEPHSEPADQTAKTKTEPERSQEPLAVSQARSVIGIKHDDDLVSEDIDKHDSTFPTDFSAPRIPQGLHAGITEQRAKPQVDSDLFREPPQAASLLIPSGYSPKLRYDERLAREDEYDEARKQDIVPIAPESSHTIGRAVSAPGIQLGEGQYEGLGRQRDKSANVQVNGELAYKDHYEYLVENTADHVEDLGAGPLSNHESSVMAVDWQASAQVLNGTLFQTSVLGPRLRYNDSLARYHTYEEGETFAGAMGPMGQVKQQTADEASHHGLSSQMSKTVIESEDIQRVQNQTGSHISHSENADNVPESRVGDINDQSAFHLPSDDTAHDSHVTGINFEEGLVDDDRQENAVDMDGNYNGKYNVPGLTSEVETATRFYQDRNTEMQVEEVRTGSLQTLTKAPNGESAVSELIDPKQNELSDVFQPSLHQAHRMSYNEMLQREDAFDGEDHSETGAVGSPRTPILTPIKTSAIHTEQSTIEGVSQESASKHVQPPTEGRAFLYNDVNRIRHDEMIHRAEMFDGDHTHNSEDLFVQSLVQSGEPTHIHNNVPTNITDGDSSQPDHLVTPRGAPPALVSSTITSIGNAFVEGYRLHYGQQLAREQLLEEADDYEDKPMRYVSADTAKLATEEHHLVAAVMENTDNSQTNRPEKNTSEENREVVIGPLTGEPPEVPSEGSQPPSRRPIIVKQSLYEDAKTDIDRPRYMNTEHLLRFDDGEHREADFEVHELSSQRGNYLTVNPPSTTGQHAAMMTALPEQHVENFAIEVTGAFAPTGPLSTPHHISLASPESLTEQEYLTTSHPTEVNQWGTSPVIAEETFTNGADIQMKRIRYDDALSRDHQHQSEDLDHPVQPAEYGIQAQHDTRVDVPSLSQTDVVGRRLRFDDFLTRDRLYDEKESLFGSAEMGAIVQATDDANHRNASLQLNQERELEKLSPRNQTDYISTLNGNADFGPKGRVEDVPDQSGFDLPLEPTVELLERVPHGTWIHFDEGMGDNLPVTYGAVAHITSTTAPTGPHSVGYRTSVASPEPPGDDEDVTSAYPSAEPHMAAVVGEAFMNATATHSKNIRYDDDLSRDHHHGREDVDNPMQPSHEGTPERHDQSLSNPTPSASSAQQTQSEAYPSKSMQIPSMVEVPPVTSPSEVVAVVDQMTVNSQRLHYEEGDSFDIKDDISYNQIAKTEREPARKRPLRIKTSQPKLDFGLLLPPKTPWQPEPASGTSTDGHKVTLMDLLVPGGKSVDETSLNYAVNQFIPETTSHYDESRYPKNMQLKAPKVLGSRLRYNDSLSRDGTYVYGNEDQIPHRKVTILVDPSSAVETEANLVSEQAGVTMPISQTSLEYQGLANILPVNRTQVLAGQPLRFHDLAYRDNMHEEYVEKTTMLRVDVVPTTAPTSAMESSPVAIVSVSNEMQETASQPTPAKPPSALRFNSSLTRDDIYEDQTSRPETEAPTWVPVPVATPIVEVDLDKSHVFGEEYNNQNKAEEPISHVDDSSLPVEPLHPASAANAETSLIQAVRVNPDDDYSEAEMPTEVEAYSISTSTMAVPAVSSPERPAGVVKPLPIYGARLANKTEQAIDEELRDDAEDAEPVHVPVFPVLQPVRSYNQSTYSVAQNGPQDLAEISAAPSGFDDWKVLFVEKPHSNGRRLRLDESDDYSEIPTSRRTEQLPLPQQRPPPMQPVLPATRSPVLVVPVNNLSPVQYPSSNSQQPTFVSQPSASNGVPNGPSYGLSGQAVSYPEHMFVYSRTLEYFPTLAPYGGYRTPYQAAVPTSNTDKSDGKPSAPDAEDICKANPMLVPKQIIFKEVDCKENRLDDKGINVHIEGGSGSFGFEILPEDDTQYELFYVDEETGWIHASSPVSSEDGSDGLELDKSYHLRVRVTDLECEEVHEIDVIITLICEDEDEQEEDR